MGSQAHGTDGQQISLSFFALLFLFLISPTVASRDITSYAIVKKDGSLLVRGKKIWLYGIHFPKPDSSCRRTRTRHCDLPAVSALKFKIGPHFVTCRPVNHYKDRSIAARCWVKGDDLAAHLIKMGWAMARPGAPFEYFAHQEVAQNRGAGIWGIPVNRYAYPRYP